MNNVKAMDKFCIPIVTCVHGTSLRKYKCRMSSVLLCPYNAVLSVVNCNEHARSHS